MESDRLLNNYSSMETSGKGTGGTAGVVNPDSVSVTAASAARDFDVLVYGIGYTGDKVVQQLIQRSKDEKLNLRLAISARNSKKVADYRAWLDVQVEGTGITVHSEVISLGGGAPAEGSSLLEGEATNKSLFDLCAKCHVCINTAGPYRDQCGEVVVRTCIRAGTHYVDTNGEPDFTSLMARKYWTEAKEKKVLLVYSAGFDSVPVDMGCYKIQQEALATEDKLVSISAFVNMIGKPSISHGTTRTLVEAMAGATLKYPDGPVDQPIPSAAPKLSSGFKTKKSPVTNNEVKLRMVPDANNVMWSYKLHNNGSTEGFEYAQYVDLGGEQVENQFGSCFMCCLGTCMVFKCIKCACCRSCLLSLHGDENCGPEDDDAKVTSVDFAFEAKYASGATKLYEASCDEMYVLTAQAVAEAALCLRYDSELPMTGGHSAPAAALGTPYLKRLEDHKFLRFK